MKTILLALILCFTVSTVSAEYSIGKKQVKVFRWEVGNVNADSDTVTGAIPLISMPAGSMVSNIWANVVTPAAGSSAETVGVSNGDVDGFLIDAFAATASFYPLPYGAADSYAGVFLSPAVSAASVQIAGPRAFLVADTVDFIVTGTATAGKIDFYIEFMNY